MKLVIATRNRGKQEELQALLAPFRVDVLPMPPGAEVDEDGETYLENAEKKARRAAEVSGLMALADDSGIEVDALAGAPGVHSARFLDGAPDDQKCAKIIELLRSRTRRTARFVATFVLADPHRVQFVAGAALEGHIAPAARGTNGFGYDPIFIPAGLDRTLAEMTSAEKNRLSHRARAARALVRFLKYIRHVAS